MEKSTTIFTGNFANTKKYQEKGLVPISIARFNKYFFGRGYLKLAPPAWLIHYEEGKYIPHYKMEVLNKLDKRQVFSELKKISEGKDIVLLCYEKEGEFCHRRLVAEWLKEVAGEIVELGSMAPPKPVSAPVAVQMSMF